MSTNRITRVNELIKREVAGLIYRIMNQPDFDLAAVTVTHVLTSGDLRHARVLVSLRAAAERQKHMLKLLNQEHAAFQQELSRNITLKYTPHLRFDLDPSIAEGDRILHLLDEINEETHEAENGDPKAES